MVRNTGTLPLFVEGVSIGGADAGAFAIITDACTGTRVAPGAGCTIRVRFDATGTGPRSAQLLVDDNADGATIPTLSGITQPAAAPAPAPVIEHLDRGTSDAAGGALLEITGAGFSGGTVVRFGETLATTTVLRYDRLRVVIPPHAPGTVTLTVQTAAGTSAPAAFTYLAPAKPQPQASPPAGQPDQASAGGCVVPRLHGRRLHGARRALHKAGCRLGSVRHTTRRKGPRHAKVVAQSMRAGTRLPAGAAVDVTTRKRP
jgi:hypothetical protein